MRTAIKLTIYAWLAILALAFLIWSQSNSLITHYTIGSRIAAGILILMIILNFVIEFGWLGGKKINASHTWEDGGT